MKINYVVGDATKPDGFGPKCIMHICNDQGGWGGGFVLALNARWDAPMQAYLNWENYRCNASLNREASGPFELGQIQRVKVEDDISVINIIGQHRTGERVIAGVSIPPIDYRSVREGFARIKELYQESKFTLCCPRLGCGLAMGKWSKIVRLLDEVFDDTDIEIVVYDYAPDAVKNDSWCCENEDHMGMIYYIPSANFSAEYPEKVVFEGALWVFEGRMTNSDDYGRANYTLETDFTGDRVW